MLQAYQKPLSGDCVGIVFGSFAPLHQGHLDLIMRAKKECDAGVIILSCGYERHDDFCADSDGQAISRAVDLVDYH